jgi:hypothetical protein
MNKQAFVVLSAAVFLVLLNVQCDLNGAQAPRDLFGLVFFYSVTLDFIQNILRKTETLVYI